MSRKLTFVSAAAILTTAVVLVSPAGAATTAWTSAHLTKAVKSLTIYVNSDRRRDSRQGGAIRRLDSRMDTLSKLTGPKGDTGAAGATGPQGEQGVPGNDGATGLQGDQGVPGNDGASAYDLWADAGHTGALPEFLASLIGPQGPKGDAGATGPQGLKGDAGATGPQGLKGTTGATGPQGPAGPAGASAAKPLWATVAADGTLLRGHGIDQTCHQAAMFGGCQLGSQLHSYTITFNQSMDGYSFLVTQAAPADGHFYADYNKPTLFTVRQPALETWNGSDWEVVVYPWNLTGQPVAQSFTIMAIAP